MRQILPDRHIALNSPVKELDGKSGQLEHKERHEHTPRHTSGIPSVAF
jgi:hypothetical protein